MGRDSEHRAELYGGGELSNQPRLPNARLAHNDRYGSALVADIAVARFQLFEFALAADEGELHLSTLLGEGRRIGADDEPVGSFCRRIDPTAPRPGAPLNEEVPGAGRSANTPQ